MIRLARESLLKEAAYKKRLADTEGVGVWVPEEYRKERPVAPSRLPKTNPVFLSRVIESVEFNNSRMFKNNE